MTDTATPASIEDLKPLVKEYNEARDLVAGRLDACRQEQRQVIRRKWPGIASAARRKRDAEDRLRNAVEQNPELFRSPKTQTIEGVKVGFAKGRGKVVVGNNAAELIRKHMPDRFGELVKVTEKPLASALQHLTAGELRRIGCRVEDTGDRVVVSAPKDDLDKRVAALMEEAGEETEADQ